MSKTNNAHGSAKLSRVLWILNVLLSRGFLTRTMAHKELGIAHRTFFRYIGTLRDAGFMIDAEPGGVFKLRAMQPKDRSLEICTGRAKLITEADIAEIEPPSAANVHYVHAGSVSPRILAQAGKGTHSRFTPLNKRRAVA